MEWENIAGRMHDIDIKNGYKLFECSPSHMVRLTIKYDVFWKDWYLACDFLYVGWRALHAKDVEEAKELALKRLREELLNLVQKIDSSITN